MPCIPHLAGREAMMVSPTHCLANVSLHAIRANTTHTHTHTKSDSVGQSVGQSAARREGGREKERKHHAA